ncbi:MAG: NAD(P)-dependent alcohol dehydrogenase [Pyrinomonadaceae bacterium]
MRIYTTRGDGIENLKLSERPIPNFGADEVILKMTAASLNYRDLLVINGVENWKPLEARIPVSDGVGVITEAGENVGEWKTGDRVAGIFLPNWLDGELTKEKYTAALGGADLDGVLSEFAVFDKRSIVNVPGNLSDAEAATLPVAALTAWHAVSRSGIKKGESVLIQGTGGVSLFALQFAHALGAVPFVISSSDAKLEMVQKLGANVSINYKLFPEWEEKILELTHGNGVDHVIETVGGGNLNRSLAAVKTSGTIAFIGLIAGLSAPINTYQFVTKNVSIYGIETGSREMFIEMNKFIEKHDIKPVIDREFGFEEVRSALEYLGRGAHFGKVVIGF